MSYKVIGAAAVVELDDGNAELGSGPRVYLEQGQQVPGNAKAKHVEHLLNVGLVEEAAAPSGSDSPDGDGAPAKSASKADWVAFAVSKGADEAEADAQTKDDLIAAYGS